MTAPVWGFPWHGLLISPQASGKLRVGGAGGAVLPLEDAPFPPLLANSIAAGVGGLVDVHLVKVPGTPAPSLTVAQVSEQATLGRTWQNYALMHTGKPEYESAQYELHGRRIGGWICTDTAHQRWLIKPVAAPAAVSISSSLTLSFDVLPFGYIGQARPAPISISATLADIGQLGEALDGDPYVLPRVASIASHGRELIIGLLPGNTPSYDPGAPCGYLRLRLSGSGPAFAASLEVLYSRSETLGAYTVVESGALASAWLQTVSTYETTMDGTNTVVTGTFTGVTPTYTTHPGYPFSIGSKTKTAKIAGRICNVVFDGADGLSVIQADIEWVRTQSGGTPTASSLTGSSMASFLDGQTAANIDGSFGATINWSGSSQTIDRVVLKRNGVEVDRAEHIDHMTFSTSFTYPVVAYRDVATRPPFSAPDKYLGLTSAVLPWSRTVTYTVGGVLVYSSTQSYDYPFFEWTPPVWGLGVDVLINTIGINDSVGYSVLRVNNQVVSASFSLRESGSTYATFRRTHRAIASQSTWENPSSGSSLYSLNCSYNPATAELVSDATGYYSGSITHI